MPTTYGKIESEVHQLIANIVGQDVATLETNYAAASSNTNRQSPDFAFTPVRDAIVEAIIEIIHTIAENPRYPHWNENADVSAALGSGSQIPSLSGIGTPFIGAIGSVIDFSTAKVCLPWKLDKVRDYNNYSSTIYSGLTVYWYALDGFNIYHTRSSVLVYRNVLIRPTFSSGGNISLHDNFVPFIVWGAVKRLAPKEGRYMQLYDGANKQFEDFLNSIRAWGQPMNGTENAFTISAV